MTIIKICYVRQINLCYLISDYLHLQKLFITVPFMYCSRRLFISLNPELNMHRTHAAINESVYLFKQLSKWHRQSTVNKGRARDTRPFTLINIDLRKLYVTSLMLWIITCVPCNILSVLFMEKEGKFKPKIYIEGKTTNQSYTENLPS